MKNDAGLGLLAVIILIGFSILFSIRGILCDKDEALRVAQTAGYTEIEVRSHDWFLIGLRGCGSGDSAAFRLKAKNQNKQDVEFTVCTGFFFKDSTIRY